MDWTALVAAFGIGSICTALVQFYLQQHVTKNARKFTEKKEAYVGLLDALREGDTDESDQASFMIGHWINRVELVGSPEVVAQANRLKKTNPLGRKIHPDRPENMALLRAAMREDLCIDRKSISNIL